MKKISTFFKKDPNDLGRAIDEVDPKNKWVLTRGIPTIKRDGAACMVKDNVLYKRYDARLWRRKRGKVIRLTPQIPAGAIPCQEANEITGHWPHWVKCNRENTEDKYHFEAYDKQQPLLDGTYELCGPKIQGNPEKLNEHILLRHGEIIKQKIDLSFEGIKSFLSSTDIEGIVFWDEEGSRMCKIRKSDFGINR